MEQKPYQRKIYLEDKPRAQAREEVLAAFHQTPEIDWIPIVDALGRVSAEPIFAHVSMPHYHASAMDGIAVIAESTYHAHEQNPLYLKAGEQFCFVDTGNAIPAPFNAVIMIEHVHIVDEGTIEIIEPATPWQHIRPIGEDIVQEEMLFPQGHTLRPADLGVLLAAQQLNVPVVKKPVITIIPTGNELVEAHTDLTPGKIIEFNGTVFAGFIKNWGGAPHLHSIVKDEPEKIKEVLLKAAETSDMIVINAGSSAGRKDFTVHIISEIGE